MIEYLVLWFVLFLVFGTLSALAGDSFPLKSVNQKLNVKFGEKLGGKIPELLIALIIGSFGVFVWSVIIQALDYDLNGFWYVFLWIALCGISYGGKESGTHGYLEHEGSTKDTNGDGVIDNKDLRKGTTSKWNIWLASRFGFKYGDEGFSWVWAFTKGAMTTFPVLCLGMIFQPIFREIASHAKGRLKGGPNMYMEIGDGGAYATAVTLALFFVNLIG